MSNYYLTNDGKKFFADDAKHLVRLLRRACYVPSRNDQQYMLAVAERVLLYKKDADIPTGDFESFVSGLIRAGLIEKKQRR